LKSENIADLILVKLETSKFMFKFERTLLPNSFSLYFLYNPQIHNHQTRSVEKKLLYSIFQNIVLLIQEIQLNSEGLLFGTMFQ